MDKWPVEKSRAPEGTAVYSGFGEAPCCLLLHMVAPRAPGLVATCSLHVSANVCWIVFP